jgi:NAD(P)-dependent dehydrogenase (short-subunit alcohol dehydrogenase family)
MMIMMGRIHPTFGFSHPNWRSSNTPRRSVPSSFIDTTRTKTQRVVAVPSSRQQQHHHTSSWNVIESTTSLSSSATSNSFPFSTDKVKKKGEKVLVLGGTGFLGQTICRRALLEGYSVTSLSRRGRPPSSGSGTTVGDTSSTSSSSSLSSTSTIDYRMGDARQVESISTILQEGNYIGIIHCIGLLFDDESGLGTYNRLVSGSGSIPDENSTYDTITRVSAFNAIDAAMKYCSIAQQQQGEQYNTSTTTSRRRLPFVFISAAEAGWPDVVGGAQIEQYVAPEWLRRYLSAKRAVENKLLFQTDVTDVLRPIIARPSWMYSLDRPASYLSVGAFFIGSKLGLPFVDRPVTVQSVANAMVRSLSRESVEGILRYPEIDTLNE